MRLGTIGLCFIIGSTVGLSGQDAASVQKSPDLATYESFLRDLSARPLTSPAPPKVSTLNGQATDLVSPRLEDALTVTAEEAQQIRAIAADCATKVDAIDEAVKPLVKELRFEALAEEPRSEPVVRRYEELSKQRTQIVLDHLDELRTVFGEARFSQIEAVLKTKRRGESLFGPRVPLVVRTSDK